MSFYLLIRGPLGVGKSTVSERLAKKIGAQHISIDRILDERGLWEEGRVSEFLKANEFAGKEARDLLNTGTPVIIDGNFYWESQIDDLIDRLDFPHYLFTLKAPLSVCIARDGRRTPPHGAEAAQEVYTKSTRFTRGVSIDATRSADDVVEDILSRLPRSGVGR